MMMRHTPEVPESVGFLYSGLATLRHADGFLLDQALREFSKLARQLQRLFATVIHIATTIMKITRFLAAITLLGLSSVASAVPISLTGGADSLVAWSQLGNSGNASELQFIASYLGVDASTLSYTKPAGGSGEDGAWQSVDEDSSLYAFDLSAYSPALLPHQDGQPRHAFGIG